MHTSPIPPARLEQEGLYLKALFSIDEEQFTVANATKFTLMTEQLVEMVGAGFRVNDLFQTEGLAAMTPLGLFNAMALGQLRKPNVARPEGMNVVEERETVRAFADGYKRVLLQTLSTLGTIDLRDGTGASVTTARLMLRSDPEVVGGAIRGGVAFHPDVFSGLSHRELVQVAQDPDVLEALQNLPHRCYARDTLRDIPTLLLLRVDELESFLSGPLARLMSQSELNEAFHCAVADHAGGEKAALWLNAGASVEGSPDPKFGRSALGSAIHASPLFDKDGLKSNAAVLQVVDGIVEVGNTPAELLDESGFMEALESGRAAIAGLLGLRPGASLTGELLDQSQSDAGDEELPTGMTTVQVLLEYGANPNSNVGGVSPLAQAYEKGAVEIIEMLRARAAQFASPSERELAVLRCAERGSNTALKLLVADGALIDEIVTRRSVSPTSGASLVNEHTALTMAAMMGKASTVDLCLQLGADPERVVQRAVSSPHEDLVRPINFIQEAIRIDQPQVLEIAVAHLGIDRVSSEEVVPRSKCALYLQAKKALKALELGIASRPLPAP